MRIFWLNWREKIFPLAAVLLSCTLSVRAQETYPINGVADPRERIYAFTHATIIKDGQTTFSDATMLIHDGKIISAGNNVSIPSNADCDCCTKIHRHSLIYIAIMALHPAVIVRFQLLFRFTDLILIKEHMDGMKPSNLDRCVEIFTDDAKAKLLRSWFQNGTNPL
jgi:hypothetical protein